MTLKPESVLREPSNLNENDRKLIRAFMQGAIYCWVKNQPNEPFAVRDLVGGLNTNWNQTPLQILYDRHIKSGRTDDEAFDLAAIDIGWIVKSLLAEDRRTFQVDNSGFVNTYFMIGDSV